MTHAAAENVDEPMATMIFELPPNLPADCAQELDRASVAGGQDGMPYPTHAKVEDGRLLLMRDVEESGSLLAPWQVDGLGRFMVSSATLMERPAPYNLVLELARGKINQVRCQAADWLMGGLLMSDALSQQIRQATRAFGQVIAELPAVTTYNQAEVALAEAYQAAHLLVESYVRQVFQVRHSRQPRLEATLACRLQGAEPQGESAQALAGAFNAVAVPLPWREIETSEGNFDWGPHDRLVEWAVQNGYKVIGGPLIDFSGRNLPDWLWERESDLLGLNSMLCDHAERVVRRYQHAIRTWQLTAGSNCAGVLAMRDEELLWLTVRLAETVRKLNPALEVSIGLAQPWGDYLAEQEHTQPPFQFADTLLRTGVKLGSLDLEVVMGVGPRGSYCRDTLDLSRILDLYALLGVPLQVTLGYPSQAEPGPHADPDQRPGAGWWRAGYTPDTQADWANIFTSLALCKPFVRSVHWTHFTDAAPHQFAGCGLFDAEGRIKPALQELTRLRSEHLK
jgi:hypothetical protein